MELLHLNKKTTQQEGSIKCAVAVKSQDDVTQITKKLEKSSIDTIANQETKFQMNPRAPTFKYQPKTPKRLVEQPPLGNVACMNDNYGQDQLLPPGPYYSPQSYDESIPSPCYPSSRTYPQMQYGLVDNNHCSNQEIQYLCSSENRVDPVMAQCPQSYQVPSYNKYYCSYPISQEIMYSYPVTNETYLGGNCYQISLESLLYLN
uniref:Ground-like domain-containing protein n=1 Tax=Rhabditophanes sp. KR3021 TaxID=114890 RepID=A0AC35TJ02_9BILA